jgi:two-component system cell cycle sensor histidine kinase/response regulator CckA
VKETVKLVRATLPPGIAVAVDVPPRTFGVRASPAQMHQLAMNLLTNARLALGDGGTLSVSLDDVVLESDPSDTGVNLPPGAYVMLEVADTGCGMDEATLARAFEPFFTTRPPGLGTGMGLALVHGIVTGCGGAIGVESRPGAGSSFRVYLPRAPGPLPVEGEALPAPQGGGRRVLLVDDEPEVREAGRLLLESMGYRVRLAADGSAALEALRADPHCCDILFTDLRMPGVDGLDLATAARALRPELPVVLTTAYAQGPALDIARARGVQEIVLKPWRRATLSKVLASVC